MSSVTPDHFEAVTSPYRRELLAHCYRMTGSSHDAEDLVQETYLRAWRAFDRFEERSSVRTWLYRIATNACLTALHPRRRRVLPSGLGPPSPDPFAPAASPPPDVAWVRPIPDRLIVDERDDPAEVAASRESVRLALVAAAQILPARQRAAFLLCDVCGQSGADAAEALGVSLAALKSLLQRARARLELHTITDDRLAEPTGAGARRVLDSYLTAFEQSDMRAIERLLADDAVLEMTGTATWYSGKATCVPFIAAQGIGERGDWRMLPIQANGQLGAASYRRGADGDHHRFAIVVLATTDTHLRRITLFGDPEAWRPFELPAVVRR